MFRTNLLAQNFILFLNLVGPLALRIKVQDHGNWYTKLKNKPAGKMIKSLSQTLDTAAKSPDHRCRAMGSSQLYEIVSSFDNRPSLTSFRQTHDNRPDQLSPQGEHESKPERVFPNTSNKELASSGLHSPSQL